MPVQKRKKGKSKMAQCLPCTEDRSKNYVPLKPPDKKDNKIRDKDIFEESKKKVKNNKY